MAIEYADRVKETTLTTGTGTLDLDGAIIGFQSFVTGIGSTKQSVYVIDDGTSWEIGEGTITSGTPDTLSRDTVLSSSTGGKINWSGGTKVVSVANTASRMNALELIEDAITADLSQNINIGGTATSSTFIGDLTGNADTATVWETTRTIGMSGDVSSDAVSIDGSGNITITNTVVANDSHTHDMANLTGTAYAVGDGSAITNIENLSGTHLIIDGIDVVDSENYIVVTNASMGNAPQLRADGSWSDVDLNITAKGAGNVNLTSTVASTLSVTGFSSFTDTDFILSAVDNVFIDGRTEPRNITEGSIRIHHIPAIISTRAINIEVDANGFDDTMAIVTNYKASNLVTGNIGMAMEINIDTADASGGEIDGMRISKTGEGTLDVVAFATDVGVGVVRQVSGVFVNTEQGFYYDGVFNDLTAPTDYLSSNANNYTLFDENSSYLYIGMVAQFDQINVTLSTSGNHTIKPIFEYSDGVGGWNVFSANDNTAGFTGNGVISWQASILSGWSQDTVNAISSKYWVRIQRTQPGGILTYPVESSILSSSVERFSWDENGNLIVNTVLLAADPTINLQAATKQYVDNVVGGSGSSEDLIGVSNGLTIVDGVSNTSAVNHVEISNAIVGAGPIISSNGTDTDIDIILSPKGNGLLIVNGTVSATSFIGDGSALTGIDGIADVSTSRRLSFFTGF